MTDIDGTEATSQGEVTADTSVEQQDTGRTFSQAELDKIVADRLARQAKKYQNHDELVAFKANAEKERQANLSEHELQIEEAKVDAANGVRAEYALQLAGAQIQAALTGLVENPESVIEDLNLSRFVNDDFSVDTDAVNAIRAKYENLLSNKRKSPLSQLEHGKSNGHQLKGGDPMSDFAALINQLEN